MKRILLAILLVSSYFSCKEEEPAEGFSNFEELNGKVLEVRDVEGISSGESEILNIYATGIKFNSNKTGRLLDDNYGQNAYWTSAGANFNWNLSGDKLTIALEKNNNTGMVIIEILNIDKEILSVKEVNPQSQYSLRVSNKQQIQ